MIFNKVLHLKAKNQNKNVNGIKTSKAMSISLLKFKNQQFNGSHKVYINLVLSYQKNEWFQKKKQKANKENKK